jgi:hypothetical protein
VPNLIYHGSVCALALLTCVHQSGILDAWPFTEAEVGSLFSILVACGFVTKVSNMWNAISHISWIGMRLKANRLGCNPNHRFVAENDLREEHGAVITKLKRHTLRHDGHGVNRVDHVSGCWLRPAAVVLLWLTRRMPGLACVCSRVGFDVWCAALWSDRCRPFSVCCFPVFLLIHWSLACNFAVADAGRPGGGGGSTPWTPAMRRI